MSGPSVSRMETDEDVLKDRDLEINKLIKIINIIINELGEANSTIIDLEMKAYVIDLDLSDEISGFLMTVFTCLRKEENDKPGHLRFLAYTAKIGDTDITVKAVVEKVKAQNIKIDFLICTPIVELITLFRSFYDEVRTGVTRFRVRESVAKRGVKRTKEGKLVPTNRQQENTQNISQYGLTNQHISLLQGVTLAPERRTGVLRSLGPLAQAILLVMEDKFYDKLRSAMQNSLQMLPMAPEIISSLKEATHPGNVSGVMKELGDILLLTTSRSTQKIYFPLLLFYIMWQNKGTVQWSFSGAPMIKFYTDFIKNKDLKFRMRSGSDQLKTSEVVFHAMFGTYLDNLNILEQITSKAKWHTRKEVNSVFQKRGEKEQLTFTPITFKYVSKMAQSLMTKSLGNIDPMSIGRPSFTGFRKRNFTQEFLTYITTGKSALNFTSEPTQLQYALKKLKDELLTEKDKLMKAGTSKWEKKDKNGVWEKVDFEVEEGNLFFYGN